MTRRDPAEETRVGIEIGLAYGSSALAIAEALLASGVDGSRLRAFRMPDPRVEPAFEDFQPFGVDPGVTEG